MKFCLLTCYASNRLGPTSKVRNADFVFFALDVDDLRNPDKRFTLTAEEIALLNPNTRNCPIFRTKADAELTKAIYRRVPVLWREGTKHEPEVNLWRLRFTQGLFNMAADSHHFRTATELKSEGYRLEGNVFVSPFDRYLPLYEAKMLHQFDHRWATYENESTGGRDGQIEVRDARIDEKQDPSFVVQPRYWLREDVVESTMPKYPEPLALALQTDHIPSMQRLLCWWAAGFYFNHGNKEAAKDFLYRAMRFEFDSVVARNVSNETEESFASRLERDFPLNAEDVDVIRTHINDPKPLAQEFVRRFSPKWLLGWRDICRSTDERTTISTALPKSAVGDTFLLMFSQSIKAPLKLALIANLNSLVQDYSSRQKVGGTHMKYNVFRQLPVLHPDAYGGNTPWDSEVPLSTWLQSRVLELIHTAHDLDPLVVDCGNSTRPFEWQEDRRFEIRCQLDAAFFHLYLTSEANGDWQMAESETPEQLLMLKNHFNKPRDAVMYILDQFPIVRQKEGQKYGRYRTKERILEIYDSLLIAQHDLRVSS